VVPSHGGNVRGPAFGKEAGILIPDGVVDAGVPVQFPANTPGPCRMSTSPSNAIADGARKEK
jgi:hypothetical protein